MTDLPPLRICCGQRHYGLVCPDGRVMCCLCFERFMLEDLAIGEYGKLENVCLRCATSERTVP